MKKNNNENKYKNKKVIDRGVKGEDKEVYKAIKILIGVLVVFLLVYLVAALITGEIKLGKAKETETEIQYSEILAEMTFKQSNDNYFVLYYDFEDKSSDLIEAIASNLSQTYSVYKVDLSKKFNSTYLTDGEVTNKKPSNASQLKVKNPTLIKISNGKVVKYVEGLNSIRSYSLNTK